MRNSTSFYGLILAAAMLFPARAADVPALNSLGWGAREHKGQDADAQMDFSVSTPSFDGPSPSLFGLPLDLKGRFEIHGLGFVDEESSPGQVDWAPEVFQRFTVSGDASLDAGWKHESNFEDGAESEGWDLFFGRWNFSKSSGSLFLEGSASAWWAADSESEETIEVRSFGEAGRWGASAILHGRLTVADNARFDAIDLWVEFEKNRLRTTLILDVLDDSDIQPMGFFELGKGQTLEELDSNFRTAGAGVSVALF